jgi:hypothetical protein
MNLQKSLSKKDDDEDKTLVTKEVVIDKDREVIGKD